MATKLEARRLIHNLRFTIHDSQFTIHEGNRWICFSPREGRQAGGCCNRVETEFARGQKESQIFRLE